MSPSTLIFLGNKDGQWQLTREVYLKAITGLSGFPTDLLDEPDGVIGEGGEILKGDSDTIKRSVARNAWYRVFRQVRFWWIPSSVLRLMKLVGTDSVAGPRRLPPGILLSIHSVCSRFKLQQAARKFAVGANPRSSSCDCC